GEWNESVLYSFQEGSDGNSPISNLVADGVGNLYGTTSEGGLGSGTIFKLSPVGGGQWIETVVHPFEGPPDGAFAYNGMVVDRFGNFYGADRELVPQVPFGAVCGPAPRAGGLDIECIRVCRNLLGRKLLEGLFEARPEPDCRPPNGKMQQPSQPNFLLA